MVNFEKEEQQKSLERIKKAIAITSSDTLSSVHMKERVIWIASGSWLGRQTVTIGDLMNLVAFIEKKKGEDNDNR